MKEVDLKTVQTRLRDYVDSSAEQPILILRDGEPVAMLVGLGKREKRTPAKLRDILQQAWQDYEEHGGIPGDQFWKDLAKETSSQKKKRGPEEHESVKTNQVSDFGREIKKQRRNKKLMAYLDQCAIETDWTPLAAIEKKLRLPPRNSDRKKRS